jgi:hypothetical protein
MIREHVGSGHRRSVYKGEVLVFMALNHVLLRVLQTIEMPAEAAKSKIERNWEPAEGTFKYVRKEVRRS